MYQFPKASAHPWKSGALFLGNDENGNPVGVHTERHAITIAGSQAGKGVGVITPNLLRWPHNALVIDPKGETAKRTIKARETMGIPSFVFDPFFDADVPAHHRVTINPMDRLNINALTIKEDINAIADGLVARHDPTAAHWDNGGVRVIAGIIGWVKLHYREEEQNLLTVRAILRDDDLLEDTFQGMKAETRCGAVCQTAASSAYAKEGGYFVSNAQANTEWLDSDAMQKALANTTFEIDRLKWEKASLFLVLPSEYIAEHGRFLRLFVRVAINAMQKKRNGIEKKELCLFLLDEFFALGKINEVAVSAGLMAGYGLKLWPICQNLSQLYDLYGKDSAATFFGSADVQQFFGGMDDESLAYISGKIGNYDVSDLPNEPQFKVSEHTKFHDQEVKRQQNRLFFLSNLKLMEMSMEHRRESQRLDEKEYQEDLARFNTTASRVLGKPRVPADVVASIVQKPERGPSENMLVVVHGGKVLKVKLAPFYEDSYRIEQQQQATSKPVQKQGREPHPTLSENYTPTAAEKWKDAQVGFINEILDLPDSAIPDAQRRKVREQIRARKNANMLSVADFAIAQGIALASGLDSSIPKRPKGV